MTRHMRTADEVRRAGRELPDPDVEPTVTVARWAAVLGVSHRTVLYAVERKEIPHVRVGRRAIRILTARALDAAGFTANGSAAGPAPSSGPSGS